MLPKGWEKVIKEYEEELTEAYFVLKNRMKIVNIYPPLNKIMRFLYLAPLDTCSVVIVGFSDFVCPSISGEAMSSPRSQNSMLINIFTELSSSARKCAPAPLGPPFHPPGSPEGQGLEQCTKKTELVLEYLVKNWTKQGVLLINTSLTVEKQKQGEKQVDIMKHDILWRGFIRRCIQACSSKGNIIFLLWGTDATIFERDIDTSRNTVLKSVHPANKQFIGCGHFNVVNEILMSKKLKTIDWSPDEYPKGG